MKVTINAQGPRTSILTDDGRELAEFCFSANVQMRAGELPILTLQYKPALLEWNGEARIAVEILRREQQEQPLTWTQVDTTPEAE